MGKFRFTIGKKIGLGFGIIILFIIIVFVVTLKAVHDGTGVFEKTEEISYYQTVVEKPSLNELNHLDRLLTTSKQLIVKWATVQSSADDPDKTKLRAIMNDTMPRVQKRIIDLSKKWKMKVDSRQAMVLFKEIKKLESLYRYIQETLSSFADYSDDFKFLSVQPMVRPDGDIEFQYREVSARIEGLRKHLESSSKKTALTLNESTAKVSKSFNFLLYLVILGGIALTLGSVLIASFTTRSIVKPVRNLRDTLLTLGRGEQPDHKAKVTEDEIGEMSLALNNLVDGLKRTTDFSNQVGSGNFDYPYTPLSSEDVLGHALLKMRDDLAENERILEQKVIERTEEVVRQKEEIEKQRQKLEELYKDVTDSIRYAKRLQESILPPDIIVKKMLPESFILFKPKDIVSGDFYWFYQRKEQVLFAAVDCTGHGVPGAFMSLVGSNALNQAVKEHELTEPAKVLDDINKLSSEALNKGVDKNSLRDGMDISLCSLNKETLELQFSAANNPLYLIRKGVLTQINADPFAIGGFEPGTKHYTNNKLQLEKGDCIYIFSDGYADQFGGLKGKKFMYKQFRDMLLEISGMSMNEQRKFLDETIENWRGTYEQVDDMLVIGVRV
ncbi:MAG TPA: SpoIIE family protein phosphatase [Flavobacteriales bacterium]|nr:SpoIIE family protein phosphatase [Flavobacteriales bacterium]